MIIFHTKYLTKLYAKHYFILTFLFIYDIIILLSENFILANVNIIRGISAAGSAQHWQCWGQGFESPMLHQKMPFKSV